MFDLGILYVCKRESHANRALYGVSSPQFYRHTKPLRPPSSDSQRAHTASLPLPLSVSLNRGSPTSQTSERATNEVCFTGHFSHRKSTSKVCVFFVWRLGVNFVVVNKCIIISAMCGNWKACHSVSLHRNI